MTSVVAWERQVGPLSELVVASDSRLGGGEQWDACAKIFDVGREDSVLAFAGHTWRALPLVLQAVATTRSYNGSLLRTLDLPQFASHLEGVLNAVLGEAKGEAAAQLPDCEFLLAGWSWRLNDFRIYRYTFNQDQWCFKVNSTGRRLPRALRGPGRGTWFATIGTAAGGFKALWPVPMVRVRSPGRWTITPLSTSIDRPRTLHWLSIRWVDRFRWRRSIAQSASNTSQCERLTDCLRLDDPFCRTRTLTFERLCGQKPRARGPRPPPHRRFGPRAHRSWNLRRNQRGSIPERGVWRWL